MDGPTYVFGISSTVRTRTYVGTDGIAYVHKREYRGIFRAFTSAPQLCTNVYGTVCQDGRKWLV